MVPHSLDLAMSWSESMPLTSRQFAKPRSVGDADGSTDCRNSTSECKTAGPFSSSRFFRTSDKSTESSSRSASPLKDLITLAKLGVFRLLFFRWKRTPSKLVEKVRWDGRVARGKSCGSGLRRRRVWKINQRNRCCCHRRRRRRCSSPLPSVFLGGGEWDDELVPRWRWVVGRGSVGLWGGRMP